MGQREKHVSFALLVVIQLTSGVIDSEETFRQAGVLQDIHELRREVEQLRSEVRQKDERFLQSNEKVVLDWLKETVRDLNMEVNSLELKQSGQRVFDNDNSFVRVRREIIDMKRDILNLRVEEERSLSKIEELEKNVKHVSKGEEIALREVMEIKSNVSDIKKKENCLMSLKFSGTNTI